MPISVACNQCGKQLRVKDEWAGKKAKCPQCGNTFLVTAGGAAAAAPTAFQPKPGVTAFNPNAAAAAKQKREAAAGKVAIPWGLILGGGAVAVFLLLIGLFIMGPKKVWNEWEKIGDQAQFDVIDVVSRGMQCYLAENGGYDPGKGNTQAPQATEVMFYRPVWVMSMPSKVDFKGTSNQGEFKGVYNPHNGEVAADVDVGGLGFAGVGAVRKASTKIKVTGRVKDHVVSVEVNGKPMKLVIPKKTDD
jgi:hypothetical protein